MGTAEVSALTPPMQRQLLEELRHQHRQRRAGIVRQVADQAARGHVGAGLVEDVAGALDLDVGLRDLDVGMRAPIAAASGEAAVRLLAILLLVALFGSGSGVAKKLAATPSSAAGKRMTAPILARPSGMPATGHRAAAPA